MRELKARIAEKADQRETIAAKHRDELTEIDRDGETLRCELHALEAVLPLEEA